MGHAAWLAADAASISSRPLLVFHRPPTNSTSYGPVVWAVTTAAAARGAQHLVGPDDQDENQDEDESDLELESDEDHSKLRVARPPLGAEEDIAAARGGEGTINPPFP